MIDVSMLNTMQVTDQRLQKEECGLDEKELLRQLQKQRAGALEQAVAQYGAYVLAIIRNRSRGVLTPEDHEEIASDVFSRSGTARRASNAGSCGHGSARWRGTGRRRPCGSRTSIFRWRTIRSSRSTGSGSRCWNRSAAQPLRRPCAPCRMRTGKYFTGLRSVADSRADRGGLTFERVDRAFAPDARTADAARGFGKRRSVL